MGDSSRSKLPRAETKNRISKEVVSQDREQVLECSTAAAEEGEGKPVNGLRGKEYTPPAIMSGAFSAPRVEAAGFLIPMTISS